MKTVGQFLKNARVQRGLSLAEVSANTKIKKEFISGIEREEWEALPPFPVVSGFVKNYTQFLGEDRGRAMAMLRRDYPPSGARISLEPKVKRGFGWSPRLTFLAGVVVVIATLSLYLVFQFVRFRTPPTVEVLGPVDGDILVERDLRVFGITDEGVAVVVNDQPATVDGEGRFEITIELTEGKNEIVVQGVSRSGKETVVRRQVIYRDETF